MEADPTLTTMQAARFARTILAYVEEMGNEEEVTLPLVADMLVVMRREQFN